MKKYFLISLGILFLSLYSVSALYVGEISASVGENVIVTVGDNPSVNVTNDSGTTGGDTDDDTPASSGGGGGGGGGSLLSSVIKSVFNDEENETEEESNGEENPEEKTTSTNFLTGFAVGISDFAKSPGGIATFIIIGLFVVGGVTFLVLKKGKFPKIFKKKEVNSITEQ